MVSKRYVEQIWTIINDDKEMHPLKRDMPQGSLIEKKKCTTRVQSPRVSSTSVTWQRFLKGYTRGDLWQNRRNLGWHTLESIKHAQLLTTLIGYCMSNFVEFWTEAELCTAGSDGRDSLLNPARHSHSLSQWTLSMAMAVGKLSQLQN